MRKLISTEAVKVQSPGFYKHMLGKYEITSIYDGYSNIMMDTYNGMDIAKSEEIIKKEYANVSGNGDNFKLKLSINTFLINTGKELILIDTGAGKSFGPTMGKTVENLRHAGYRPEEIDKVVFTHLHPDHIGGIEKDGKPVFYNAVICVNGEEIAFWMNSPDLKKEQKDILNIYEKNKKYMVLKDNTEISNGIKGVLLPGHTIGHMGYEITSNGEKLLMWGDITLGYEIQFSNPDVTTAFEYNQIHAKEIRKTLSKKITKDGTMIAGSHLPFPGLGHMVLNSNGIGYRWIPLQYDSLN